MPSVLPPRDVLALESWRDPNQLQPNKPYSTGYNLKLWEEEGLEIPALDYEKTSRLLGFNSSSSPTGRNPQNHILLTSSSNNSRYPSYLASLRRSDSQHHRGKHTSALKMPKRPAEISPGPPPSNRRPRQLSTFNPTTLRDVSYIRNDMKVPTKEDYPNAPPDLFSNPKQILHNVLQGFPSFQSSIAEIGTTRDRVFQCKVSFPRFDKSEDIITLIGEGRSKVDSSSPQTPTESDIMLEIGQRGRLFTSLS